MDTVAQIHGKNIENTIYLALQYICYEQENVNGQ